MTDSKYPTPVPPIVQEACEELKKEAEAVSTTSAETEEAAKRLRRRAQQIRSLSPINGMPAVRGPFDSSHELEAQLDDSKKH